ncbi:hypothetical protein [Alicyclobacillus sendaiensis]|uniref:CDP-alcohol phosphatidyltransferase n=1 Tax=Alicyclobacillus sendaiensis PA2 TaxID=3029425 RepID=A0ABT6XX41_ALISE|nr:hypothetical protein [Alicyclobacillus sendaiensis]MDI9259174.1 hypothetical protein [Alicyclobacillus sendaiensis PA2]
MYGSWLDLLRLFGALLLAGLAVKWMDDVLDVDYDLCQGQRTLAARFGRAALPYAMVVMACAVALAQSPAIAAFLGAYAVGMFARPFERLPSQLPAWAESLVALGLCSIIVGWRGALWAASFMLAVDWLDDLVDRFRDAATGQWNAVIRFGLVEALLVILGALAVAIFSEVIWSLVGLVALAAVTVVSETTTSKLVPEDRGEGPWSRLS